MAAVPVMINGVLWLHAEKRGIAATMFGEATIYGLEVGGGPVYPPQPGQPPGIWGGGNVPMPSPPIAGVPGAPGYRPPGIWGGPIDPYPDHGLPQPPGGGQPPEGAADDNGFIKAPPSDGGWAYHEDYAWGYYPGPSGAGPKK